MEAYHKKWLHSNARFQESWERTAYTNIHLYTEADPVTCSNLLKVYWAWQAPLHNYAYRRRKLPIKALRLRDAKYISLLPRHGPWRALLLQIFAERDPGARMSAYARQ